MVGAGRGITVYLLDLFALVLYAILHFHLSVQKGIMSVTMDQMLDVGREISACLRDHVLLSVSGACSIWERARPKSK